MFSAGQDDEAEFHPALDLDDDDFLAVQTKMRKRGLRWLHRHGHLDDMAVHTMDSADHAGGWSVNASATIPDWDRHGLEHLVRYCARPPLSQERLGRLNAETLVYSYQKPTIDGKTELVLAPLEFLDRLSKLITPPRINKHCFCGVLAPNAKLRKAVIETAGPSGATLQLLTEAQDKMDIDQQGSAADCFQIQLTAKTTIGSTLFHTSWLHNSNLLEMSEIGRHVHFRIPERAEYITLLRFFG